ncbi:4875_t:CDS:2 [Dentiscutata heterogama]|uniref:4875_t:CDS:1 n=1 Tax=Dentiscutata heterogama TaxID=1316150 RepID=A0ACA9LYA6_9GLOM|nr:4875_t:CDS:2 [Dentiscutata heterogama]
MWKTIPKTSPECTQNNGTQITGKKLGKRTVPIEIGRFKKGNFSKKLYNKGKRKLEEEYYSESEEETKEESDNEEVITANIFYKTIQKKVNSFE